MAAVNSVKIKLGPSLKNAANVVTTAALVGMLLKQLPHGQALEVLSAVTEKISKKGQRAGKKSNNQQKKTNSYG